MLKKIIPQVTWLKWSIKLTTEAVQSGMQYYLLVLLFLLWSLELFHSHATYHILRSILYFNQLSTFEIVVLGSAKYPHLQLFFLKHREVYNHFDCFTSGAPLSPFAILFVQQVNPPRISIMIFLLNFSFCQQQYQTTWTLVKNSFPSFKFLHNLANSFTIVSCKKSYWAVLLELLEMSGLLIPHIDSKF